MRIGLGINNDLLVAARGDALAIMLSEPPGQQASWSIDVWAELDGRGSAAGRGRGAKPRTYVGTINTVPVAVGTMQDRIVAQAVCPGARAWILSATGPAPGFTGGGANPIDALAELDASPSPCCGFTTGIYLPNAPNRIITNSGPSAASRVDSTVPIQFLSAFGWAPPAFAPNDNVAEDYVMFFNSATVPANGTAPFNGLQLAVTPGSSFNFSLNAPMFFSVGLSWAISSTPDTLTLGTSKIAVTTRVQW